MTTFETFFHQQCPVCGRPLQVPVSLLGETAACPHCRAWFRAADHGDRQAGAARSSSLSRVEKLLADCAPPRD